MSAFIKGGNFMDMTVRMDDEFVKRVGIQIKKDDGSVIHKTISLQDFLNLLQGSSDYEGMYIPIGEIPHGYYNAIISNYYENTFAVDIVVPAGVRSTTYMEKNYKIPYPNLLFRFFVKQKQLNKSKCFALKTKKPSKNEPLFYYPFGNVYSDGSICWGGNYFGELYSMKELDEVVSIFFGSPTNNDLYSSEHLNDAPYTLLLRAFYEELDGKKQFPIDLLRRCGNYNPVDEISIR